MRWQVIEGDCLAVLPTLEAGSVDAIVTDPPYGLSFMGKNWDHGVPGEPFWREALRVAKPGAHLLAFGGTRTFHRLACAIEDAGWQLRDTIGVPHESGDWGDCPWLMAWCYGSGFPKSLDISKAIDALKTTGGSGPSNIRRRDMGKEYRPHALAGTEGFGTSRGAAGGSNDQDRRPDEPIEPLHTDSARRWSGWGTALKPAWEPIIVARKPLDGTVAENVLRHGTGGINVDGCRVGYASDADKSAALAGDAFKRKDTSDRGWSRPWMEDAERIARMNREAKERAQGGRWPANLIHDGSEEVVGLFPQTTQASWRKPQPDRAYPDAIFPQPAKDRGERGHGDTGSAARFFYCAKASKADRDEGCEGLEERTKRILGEGIISADHPDTASGGGDRKSRNHHPTVKPTDLMQYLVRLVTPPNGVVLDPFTGSGSTGKAAILEGFRFIGIEQDAGYCEIARRRIKAATPPLFAEADQ